jgi:hypothetical protein
MDASFEADSGEPIDGDEKEHGDRPRIRLADLPIDECDHSDLLQALIVEGAEAAMETFFEAKDPDIDPALKLKLINLASHVGDNVRKAIATHAAHFGRQGRADV